MRSQSVSRLMLSVMLLVLAGGTSPVHGVPIAALGETAGSSASSIADAPWFKMEVDTDGDTGHHVWAESTDAPYHHTWRIRTVDRGSSTENTGLYTSLALPSYGSPRISYHYRLGTGAACP